MTLFLNRATVFPLTGNRVTKFIAPQADAVLQEVATGRRVWVELEVSRADPVANHAKFATAHLVSPMPRRASAFPLQMKPAVTDSRYKFESARPFHA
jgi:hypothetical protein